MHSSRWTLSFLRAELMRVEPLTLRGAHVILEPLTMEHLNSLCEVGLNPELWRWTTNLVRSRNDLRLYVEIALREQAAGTALPFATIDTASGKAIGSTRFANIDRANRRVEIGWTWIGVPWQRTPANTEAKYLMLRHAFETLGCIRVEFKTDSLNVRSRNALIRIGAREEGTLRNHMLVHDGRYRHSVYFSVIESEWPAVKELLEQKLSRNR